MKNMNWEFCRIFLAVGRHGGLSGAADFLGLSAATIGRRMLEFEQSMGKVLFDRSATGYSLTGDGHVLFDQLLEMEAAARQIDAWREASGDITTVRVACGSWIARLLGQSFAALCSPRDRFRLAFQISERRARLVHRENDIGVRAVAPHEAGLASMKVGEVAYCAYRARNASPGTKDSWIAISADQAVSPYQKWVHDTASDRISVTVDQARALLDLAQAGAGNAVLPCFVGDLEPGLERVGAEIGALRHGQWIVANNDDRHRRDIRLAMDRMSALLRRHATLFAGKMPLSV